MKLMTTLSTRDKLSVLKNKLSYIIDSFLNTMSVFRQYIKAKSCL